MRLATLLKLLLIAVLLAAAGCSRLKQEDATERLPVDQLYDEAKTSLKVGNIDRAVRYYRRLIARFPFGRYTEQAQLELGYALYKDHEPEEAQSQVNRFIKTYPTHKHVDYAYFLRGLINFHREIGLLERYLKQDMSRRDQGHTLKSFNDFNELVKRFPTSRYAADARQRMVYLRNGMARHELNIARYYFRHEAYIAAANRGKFVLETYQRTPEAADALAIMTESYKRLGETELAADSERVLKLNFADHPYFRGAWPARPSWWQRLVPFRGNG